MSSLVHEIAAALNLDGKHYLNARFACAIICALVITLQAPFSIFRANLLIMDIDAVNAFSIAFLLSVALSANLAAWVTVYPGNQLFRSGYIAGVSCILVAVLICLACMAGLGFAGTALLVVLGIAAGISLVFLFLLLAYVYIHSYIPDIVRCAFMACALTILCEVFVIGHLTATQIYIGCAVLTAGNTGLLIYLLKNKPAVDISTQFVSFKEVRDQTSLYIMKIFVPLACTGFIIRTLYTPDVYVDSDAILYNFPDVAYLIIALIVAFIILSFALYGTHSFGWPFVQLFSFLIPLLCLICSLTVNDASGVQNDVSACASIIVLCLVLTLTWSFLSAATLEYLLHAVSVFGMGLGACACGLLIADRLVPLSLFGSAAGGITLVCICLLMAIGYLPANPAKNLFHSTYGQRKTPYKLQDIGQCGMQGGPATCPANTTLHTDTGVAIHQQPRAEQNENGTHNLVDGSPAAQTPHEGAKNKERPARGKFLRRCDLVARMFLLTDREAEILILLAKGYSMVRIMAELYISEGTTKTHINHIYKKLNVHSRHELLDLVDSIDLAQYEQDS